MNEFTFVVITYNHEKYVIEHLNSIKEIVESYGSDYETSLVVCDDCSIDCTVDKCSEWIKDNSLLFKESRIIVNDSNVGIVKNYINALKSVQTKDFKVLAGDDTYRLFDIYSVYKQNQDNILITHVNLIGPSADRLRNSFDVSFYLLYEMSKKNKIKKLISIDNFIVAPGVFVPGKFLKDEKLFDFMSDLEYAEDYCQWIYLIVNKSINTVVEDLNYINYRVGVGISTDDSHKDRVAYLNEQKKRIKKLKIKNYILPKFINPYRYWLKYKMKRVQKALKYNKLSEEY